MLALLRRVMGQLMPARHPPAYSTPAEAAYPASTPSPAGT